MTNKKKSLIEALHGSFMFMDNLPALIEKEDIYDETGHVDCEFMTAILEWMSRNSEISLRIQKALNKLLGIEDLSKNKKKDEDKGSKWSTEEILKHCTLEDNVLRLPAVQFNKKAYAEVKKWIEEAGGLWQGGKIQGFTFPFNPERVFSILKEGKRYNLQKEFQFFETPDEVADWLVMLAGGINLDDKILEPSAGRGALIKAIHRACPSVIVECYELMPENREFLNSLDNIVLLGEDFTKNSKDSYSKIIANPPFANNQDIEHVRLMYERLKEHGTLAAITSPHWKLGTEKKCEEFRRWFDCVGGKSFEIEAGAFSKSGTSIATIAIVITR